MKMTQKAGIIGVSSALLFAGVLPAAASPTVPVAAADTTKVVSISAAGVDQASMEVPVDTKVSKDEAIALARKYGQIPEEFTVDNVSFQSMEGLVQANKGGSWNINFTMRKEDRYFGNIQVTIHSDTGKLLQYSRWFNHPDEQPSYPPETDIKEGKAIAEKFAQDLYPEEFKQTRYSTSFEDNFKTPLNGDIRYNYRFDRVVNGIVYTANAIYVEVDGKGRVVGFNYSWDADAKFEQAGSSLISKEQAIEIWKKESPLTTSYFKPYEVNWKEQPFSVAYNFMPVQVEATTGKLFPEGVSYSKDRTPLTAAPLGEAPKPGKMITKEQAVQAVTSAFALPKNAKLENATYSEYSDGRSTNMETVWNINWLVTEEESKDSGAEKTILPYPNYIWAQVNAVTGEVRSFSSNNYMPMVIEEKDAKISFEDAKAKAIDTVKKLTPYLTHQLVLESTNFGNTPEEVLKTQPTLYFNFTRVIEGINAGYESVNINIDRRTGEITNYYNNLSTQEYPAEKPELIDPEKALELWQSQYDIELQYVPQGFNGAMYPEYQYKLMMASGDFRFGAAAAGDQTNKLVYVSVPKFQNMFNGIFLDAVTGEWRNASNGQKAIFGKLEAKDTAGHWAGKELQLMVEYGALDLKDGNVNPDKVATRGEMLKMLLTAMNGGYFPIMYESGRAASFADVAADNQYFAYVENAVDRNLIDKNPNGTFNPDAPMTREDMAELIVRALGYNSLAKTPDLFKLSAADSASISKQGHVAIVLGLGIMTTSEGSFSPDTEVTRAQAAVAFFRYLEKRVTLQDSAFPYYYK